MTASLAPIRVNPWQADTVVVQSITPEVPDVFTYQLQFVDKVCGQQYACKPGQFNMLYVPGVGDVPISVSGRGEETGGWYHTIRTVGNVTRAIEQMGLGVTLGLRGPFGTAWPLDECRGRDVLLVAGGIGLAPLRPAIEHLLANRAQYGRVTLIYGARSPDLLLYTSQYQNWRQDGLTISTTVDRALQGWQGNIGVVPLLLDRLRPLEVAKTTVMMCGPEVMMRYAARSLYNRGLRANQIYASLERNMQCAVGHCGHCQLGPAFICRNGPVFRYDTIEPYLRVENL